MKIHNTLTKRLESFKPIDDKSVTIYVCGITPYDTTHLGHASTYIFFDALIRYLKFKGYTVIYTQNVTDINDRDKDILQKAKEQKIPWSKLAEFWTKKFLNDMHSLNWTPPDNFLKASEQIPAMITLIQKLLKNNLSYQVKGSIYLDISKVKNYGKLSKFSNPKMLKVAEEFEEDLKNPDKKNPLDITLWRATEKNQPSHIPSFDSPFGKGRPGWHIECSAMSISSLGEQIDPFDELRVNGERSRTIDIHGGGADLIFPHHEAEIAQSEGATGKIPFAKFWIHTQPVFYRGQKMSKSKGNLVMVSDLLKKYSPNAIRWLLLSNHFRKKWEYKEEDLIKAQKNIDAIEKVLALQGVPREPIATGYKDQFIKIMDENVNTPKALKFLLKLAKENSKKDLLKLMSVLGFDTKKLI
ncbi:MAG: Cysteinyl-tRNA synthetase [uncultured bacterium]|uniref:Cysteine--tRNA ligase n=1 Tax=Candidatus Daviesbacteria bacterium GW2011_GWC2_40_12 TaxID=1618431 RepID=A0A0G0QK61_9BACT|nr:MAG: Cysteinyl-tRNA synthetase [uncultured bacterium]KKR40779.1 MAG: Cysteine-tRNA ligase [Candidatus Daviesbacteria bacterium GW2011_GWC2_40_12]OGE22446.1 MAG: cysteine--tRNA ligase [Candidatus Daviesbacteria bacterium RIFCSPHIGHO2_01_FULL_40_24]OGE30492.1 MAG: cysteine--tRNA ligase [Candidatus Daviesbacteria bacterium RIFCSPHIGHO2_02_FULL_40_16]OGE43214.1 MAG: cysteine--tRNA ligase [Candidatus Daviesbacteria bacterium RIFCSPLOWO2_01_FULL_39_23]OGE65916.1 MAG: cysteine--tRNA ligase [Candid